MIRHSLVLLLVTVVPQLRAQGTPAPEECLAGKGSATVTVSHAEKEYRLATEACREQFLSDPERYSQLYDALLELQREGTPIKAQAASLVPS